MALVVISLFRIIISQTFDDFFIDRFRRREHTLVAELIVKYERWFGETEILGRIESVSRGTFSIKIVANDDK